MKWNVGTKIAAAFGITLAILILAGVTAYRSTVVLVDAGQWREHTYAVLTRLADLRLHLREIEAGQRGYVLTADETYLEPYQAALAAFDPTLAELRALTKDNPRQQERLARLEPVFRTRADVARETVDARRNSNSIDTAVQIIRSGRGTRAAADILQGMQAMDEEEKALLVQRSTAADEAARNAKTTLVASMLVAIAFAAIAGLVIARNIARPLQELTSIADRITQGDLTAAVTPDERPDEVGLLTRTFERMLRSLRTTAAAADQIAAGDLRGTVQPQSANDQLGQAFVRMSSNLRQQIGGLAQNAVTLGSAATEIVASTVQLASSASQTATAVTETTTTVEEIRQTAHLANQKAKTVADTAQKTAQISQVGRKSIEDANVGMGRIRAQMEAIGESMMRLSEQNQIIGQIIATVEDLAAQSNLLAVNAAIEAAKAGEHGKGFGVVAQEVKSLAEQSRQATDRVRTILGDVQKATTAAVMATEQGTKAVEGGSRQTEIAGESIQSLASSIVEAAQAATQIAASSQQQLVGMDQVAAAMENIKQASTQNVASARQLESSARGIGDLGQRLQQLVSNYAV